MAAEPHNPISTRYPGNSTATPTDGNSTARAVTGGNDDIEVVAEFVVLDGPEGEQLQALQAEAVQQILRALHKARTAPPKGDSR
jgi:hypothetical protein